MSVYDKAQGSGSGTREDSYSLLLTRYVQMRLILTRNSMFAILNHMKNMMKVSQDGSASHDRRFDIQPKSIHTGKS